MKRTLVSLIVIVVFSAALFITTPARADVAPPEMPPGTNLVPGSETTQVRMTAETVILSVDKDPAAPKRSIARTEASFTMRNLGAEEEKMSVRFPLTFFNGNSDGFGNFPEIPAITVTINGKSVSTRREMQPFLPNDYSYHETNEIPWAVFDVTFPPAQDVTLKVVYTVRGFGYYPFDVFKYVLQTGAGWNGTIGAADIIIRFPYEVSEKNVLLQGGDNAGYGSPSSGAVIHGNELRWHFENFEPTATDDITIVIITPSLWQTVLKETATVTKNPKDGEAWGRLGKAYKESIRFPKGYLRDDPAAKEMFQLSREAYETCLDLLPKDSLWHYGYADLLWSHYLFDVSWNNPADPEGILPLTLSHLQTALQLDPKNQQARDLLTSISYDRPNAVQMDGDNFIFLGLTATPLPPTPWQVTAESVVFTPTTSPAPTATRASSTPSLNAPASPTSAPPAINPICGSSALLLPALAGVWLLSQRRKILQ